jgi:hypothetical protein
MFHGMALSTLPIGWNCFCPDLVNSSPRIAGISGARIDHNGRSVRQIKRHDRSHLVELRDGSAWRIWPGDIPKTLQWRPTTDIDVADIDHKSVRTR